jgi:hypothetical protein
MTMVIFPARPFQLIGGRVGHHSHYQVWNILFHRSAMLQDEAAAAAADGTRDLFQRHVGTRTFSLGG